MDPEIVFLDEPTSGLDVQSVRVIRGLLLDLKKEGKTFFLTTHNMSEAAEMCDRVAIINQGKLVALDTPGNLRIIAGKINLVDVIFDKPVSVGTLEALSGVIRVETSQSIDNAERMKAISFMSGMGRGGRMGPGMKAAGMNGRQVMGLPQPEPGEAGEKQPPFNRFRFHTEDTGKMITSLVDFSRANSLKMNILNVHPPSLEDAFVMLTGEAQYEK